MSNTDLYRFSKIILAFYWSVSTWPFGSKNDGSLHWQNCSTSSNFFWYSSLLSSSSASKPICRKMASISSSLSLMSSLWNNSSNSEVIYAWRYFYWNHMRWTNALLKNQLLPHSLTQSEIEDPYQVIDELFDFDHYPCIKELLWEWFKLTVNGNYNSEETSTRDRCSVTTLYEKLDKIIEAVWVIKKIRYSKG